MFWYIFVLSALLDTVADTLQFRSYPLLQASLELLIEPKIHSFLFIFLMIITKLQSKKIRQISFASLFLYPLLFCFKFVVGRARPYLGESLFSLHPLELDPAFSSFPSSHAAALGLFFSIFPLKGWKVMSLLAFVRVVQGVHYPSDVVVGFLVGFMIPKATNLLLDQFERFPPLSWIIKQHPILRD